MVGAVATLILVRHGRSTANTDGVLAGRTPGTHLDDDGREQAAKVAERLAGLPLARIVSSPLERCRQTAAAIAKAQRPASRVRTDRRLLECDYGDWTGRRLKELTRTKLWRTVQDHPSGAVFPGGESMRAMQARAVDAARDIDAEVTAEHGAHALWVAVSHGDLIKSVVADALGMPLDTFQRIVAEPASVSVISYTERRPFVLHVNDHGSDLSRLVPRRGRRGTRRRSGDAAVGGGA